MTESGRTPSRYTGLTISYALDMGPRAFSGWGGQSLETTVEDASQGLDRPVFYVCGETQMVAEMLRLLSESGVPESDVLLEVFRGYRG